MFVVTFRVVSSEVSGRGDVAKFPEIYSSLSENLLKDFFISYV